MRRAELNSDDALRIVQALKDRELINMAEIKLGNEKFLFTDFLEEFWDYEASLYVKEKLARGHSIGKRHCYEMMKLVHSFYDDYFAGRTLCSITRQDLKEFSLSLAEKREKPNNHKGQFSEKLSASSINKILITATTALSWAFREGLVAVDSTSKLMRLSGTTEKRGVLTPLEVQALFATQWRDKRAQAASLLACTTGMRNGEVLALKLNDIGEKVINVRHSWSAYDGLKTPKNGEARRVPLLPEVREKLLELANDNLHGEEGFIFYGSPLYFCSLWKCLCIAPAAKWFCK